MNLGRLAWLNIKGSAFRSSVVLLCTLVVTAFYLSTTLIMRGVQDSLQLGIRRLGADIIVVPEGTQSRVETALLMGTPAAAWMPEANLAKLARVAGVAVASPQIYLSTLTGASCCSVSEMFLVAYDPRTDFTIEPWLISTIGDHLRLGEVVGGTYVFTPEGENITIYGYIVTLKANLEATGTGLDQTMFLTMETARDIARLSYTRAVKPLDIPAGSISAVLLKVHPGSDPNAVALQILKEVPGVTPIVSPDLFRSFRQQMTGLLRGILVILSITWGLCIVLIGLVFSMAVNERRREIGVLRALGSTRNFIFQHLILEAGLLALAGGGLGITLASVSVYLFRRLIMVTISGPFHFPDAPTFLALVGGGLALALLSVALAALFPALRISHQDPAVAMRE